MNKVLAIFAIGCLVNVSLSARLPRKADTNDSSSSSSSEEDVSLPQLFTLLIENIAVTKNIPLTEAQKSSVSEILNKGWTKSASDKDEVTLEDIEKLKTELTAVIPSEVAEEVSSMMSKFSKEASPAEAAEGMLRMFVLLLEGAVKSLDDALKASDTAETTTSVHPQPF